MKQEGRKRRGCGTGCFIFLLILLVTALAIWFWADFSASFGKQPRSFDRPRVFSTQMNILVLGSDARSTKERGRADTIMLLHLDLFRPELHIVSVPRDSRVKIPGHGTTKINAAYRYGGPDLMAKTLKDFLEVPIHHYVEVDFEGFERLVDAVGGVTVTLEHDLVDPLSGANFRSGTQHLSGQEALALVRSRAYPRADLDRVKVQQYFVKQLLRTILSPKVLFTRLPRIISAVRSSVDTDMGLASLAKAACFAGFGLKRVDSSVLPGKTQTIDGVSYYIVNAEQARELVSTIFGK